MTTDSANSMPSLPGETPASLDDLARRKGVHLVESVADMAQDGVFDSDEELEAFLEHVHAARQADVA